MSNSSSSDYWSISSLLSLKKLRMRILYSSCVCLPFDSSKGSISTRFFVLITLIDGEAGIYCFKPTNSLNSSSWMLPPSVLVTLACSKPSSKHNFCYCIFLCLAGHNLDCNFSRTLFFMIPTGALSYICSFSPFLSLISFSY